MKRERFSTAATCKPSAVQATDPPAAKNPSTAAADVATLNPASEEFELGKKYLFGIGVPKDEAKGIALIRKAAEHGEADAQYTLAGFYRYGQGVPQDDAQAVKWLREAAEQGEANAQYILGGFYRYGQGVPQDDAQAVKWLRKAAEQGEAMAQFNLGTCYANGEGVPKNNVEAYKWFDIVVAQGGKGAAENRQRIADQMTPDQIAEAKRLSSAFVPRKQSWP